MFIQRVDAPGFSSVSSALLTDSQGPAPMPVKNRPTNRSAGIEDEETHKSPRHIRSAAQSTTRRLPRESESMPEMSTLHKEPMAYTDKSTPIMRASSPKCAASRSTSV